MITLKIADTTDRALLAQLAKKMYDMSPYTDMPFDEDYVTHGLTPFITGDKSTNIAIMSYYDHEPAGVLLAFVSPNVFNGFKIAFELCWFVEPLYARKGVSFALIEAYETWAKKVGCEYVTVSRIANNPQGEVVDKKLQERGYSPVEHVVMKRL